MKGRVFQSLVVLWAMASVVVAEPLRNAELPGDSLYRLGIQLQTAEGATLELASLRGKPILVTLFYSQCSSVCPLITAQLQNIERQLSPEVRGNITVLMVSLDAARDSPDRLQSFKQEHHIRNPNWIVARAAAGDVRLLAAALGVRYRELPDQSFNHSSVITLAGRDGVVKARAEGIQAAVDSKFLEACRASAASAAASPPGGERERLR